MDLAREGRWLQIRLADQRTGWISERYVGRVIAGSPPPETAAERLVWASPEGCQQVVASGGRMAPLTGPGGHVRSLARMRAVIRATSRAYRARPAASESWAKRGSLGLTGGQR
jgi:hypothetical protein